METKYILVLNDGNVVGVSSDLNLEEVLENVLIDNSLVIKLGRKVILKHMIAALAPVSAKDINNHNIQIVVNGHNLYTFTEIDNIDTMMDDATESINSKNFAIINNDIIVNRSYIQAIEEVTVQK